MLEADHSNSVTLCFDKDSFLFLQSSKVISLKGFPFLANSRIDAEPDFICSSFHWISASLDQMTEGACAVLQCSHDTDHPELAQTPPVKGTTSPKRWPSLQTSWCISWAAPRLRALQTNWLNLQFYCKGYKSGPSRWGDIEGKDWNLLCPLLVESGHVTHPTHGCVHQPGSLPKPRHPEFWLGFHFLWITNWLIDHMDLSFSPRRLVGLAENSWLKASTSNHMAGLCGLASPPFESSC